MRQNNAFTLVEMMVVVGIVAILVAALITLTRQMEIQSKEQELKAAFSLLDAALQEYHEQVGSLPLQADVDFRNAVIHSEYAYAELMKVPAARTLLDKLNDALTQNRIGGLGPEIYDPWGTVLDYRYVAGENFPQWISAGPDRVFGTPDDMNSRGK